MNRFLRIGRLAAMAAMLLSGVVARADDTNVAPDFKEVYDLIRSNLAGQSDEELNHAAVTGLLEQLRSRVSLVTTKGQTESKSDTPLLSKSEVYDSVAYVRIGRVGEGLGDKIADAVRQTGTNKAKGVVLDLRYAGGRDYAAAASAADQFIAKEKPLLDPGTGMVKSKEKQNAITLPVVTLVNRQTAAGAEALAAILREADQGIVIGAPTAGEATVGKEYPLKNGQYLRIATAAIKLGNGDAIPAAGLKPDIAVAVKPEDEKAYFADPYKELPSGITFSGMVVQAGSTTNRTRTRPNEADLIRERKERPGVDVEGMTQADTSNAEPDKPVIRDPALARALDLIKGIAAMKQPRTP